MGYSFNEELSVGCSDMASDDLYVLTKVMVKHLESLEKNDNSPFNTDGILNVAMIIQDNIKTNFIGYSPLDNYITEFIPKFEKYIEQHKSNDWGSDPENIDNKTRHIKAYEKVLANLKAISNEINEDDDEYEPYATIQIQLGDKNG